MHAKKINEKRVDTDDDYKEDKDKVGYSQMWHCDEDNCSTKEWRNQQPTVVFVAQQKIIINFNRAQEIRVYLFWSINSLESLLSLPWFSLQIVAFLLCDQIVMQNIDNYMLSETHRN